MKNGDKLEVIQKKLDEITPYENNPRHNDEAVGAVAASIREFGFQQPIVTDKDGVIIVGHTRLKAAKKLGLETVPVVVADLDEQCWLYKERYGDKVVVFDKKEQAESTDTMTASDDLLSVVFARNACYKIAKGLGLNYFAEFDDDIDSIIKKI